MAQTRKDLRGRVLRKGESQRRSDGRYVYTYTDPFGRRKYVYAQDLVTLWEKEAQLMKDQMDGLNIYVAGKATVNFVFDRYMSLKNNLKPTTKSNYLYMYERFIRETFGKRNIAEIKYSDVVQFYNHLIEKQKLVVSPLEGFWWQDNVKSVDYTNKSAFNWISVIRLPDFIAKKDFDWAVETASKKKK